MFKYYGTLPLHISEFKILKGKHPKPVSTGLLYEVLSDKGRDVTGLSDKLEDLSLL